MEPQNSDKMVKQYWMEQPLCQDHAYIIMQTTMVVLNIFNHSVYEHACSKGEQVINTKLAIATLYCLEFTFSQGGRKLVRGTDFGNRTIIRYSTLQSTYIHYQLDMHSPSQQ